MAGNEVLRAIFGAWRLARLDPDGMNWFDLSFEGLLRSFLALPLLLPPYALLVLLHYDPEAGGVAGYLGIEFAGYAIAWLAFPLAMAAFVRAFDLGQNYVPFVVAYNWSQVIVMAVLLPAVALASSGLLSAGIGAALTLAVMLAAFYYLWFIARTALGASPALAALAVALEFALTYLVRLSLGRLL